MRHDTTRQQQVANTTVLPKEVQNENWVRQAETDLISFHSCFLLLCLKIYLIICDATAYYYCALWQF